jgi:uncharacterized protein (TIGR03067 family)
MRRTVWLLIGVLLCVISLASDSPKEYDDRTAVDVLEGTWRQISAELDGKQYDPGRLKWMICHRGTLTFTDNGPNSSPYRYRIDTTHKPPHLDFWPSTPTGTVEGHIYQIDGDTLKLAGFLLIFGGEVLRHPKGFNDEGVYVWTFKRVK